MQTSTRGTSATGISAYQKLGVQSEIESASSHRLIQMLLDGALSKIAIARGCLERGETSGKCQNISWAISIIDGLRASLNVEAGGEIAANLSELYQYMNQQLVVANLNNDGSKLEEVHQLLTEIHAGWDGISGQFDGEKIPESA